MPPKAAAAETETIIFDKAQAIKKMFEENAIRRNKAMETSKTVIVPKPKDPTEKLKERLATYRNVRKMRTDYKNYVKKYGTPSFYVPEELWRSVNRD
jgi:hypothetical protein